MSKLPKVHLRHLMWGLLVAALLIDRACLSTRLEDATQEVDRLNKAAKMADFVEA